jgi:signal transduction histidine kinase
VTGRIVTGFLGVLVAVLIAVVIPLGIIVTRQQAADFADQTDRAAQAISAVAEEHLDDHASATGMQNALDRFAADGYGTVVLDAAGRSIARAGLPVPAAVTRAARTKVTLPQPPDLLAVTAPIGDTGRSFGLIVLVHDTSTLDHRRSELWIALTGAAVVTFALGAAVAWLLSRWIARPLTNLVRAAHGVGRNDRPVRADEHSGPAQVRDLATAFNTMTNRVGALLTTQRDMTAEVSHQLRTPLAALRLRLELHRDELPDSRSADITAMIDEIGRLTRLLDGLLAVARAEATSASPTRTDPSVIAAERVAAWQPVAADQQIELAIDAAPATADITPGYLEQILDNLLDNAIAASPPGSRVVLAIRQTDSGAVITVRDSGPGMSAEQQTQALHRWTTDRAGNGGTGLGLAVVRRLVEADHGTLTLDRAPAGGLQVEIRFPRPGPSRTAWNATPR